MCEPHCHSIPDEIISDEFDKALAGMQYLLVRQVISGEQTFVGRRGFDRDCFLNFEYRQMSPGMKKPRHYFDGGVSSLSETDPSQYFRVRILHANGKTIESLFCFSRGLFVQNIFDLELNKEETRPNQIQVLKKNAYFP